MSGIARHRGEAALAETRPFPSSTSKRVRSCWSTAHAAGAIFPLCRWGIVHAGVHSGRMPDQTGGQREIALSIRPLSAFIPIANGRSESFSIPPFRRSFPRRSRSWRTVSPFLRRLRTPRPRSGNAKHLLRCSHPMRSGCNHPKPGRRELKQQRQRKIVKRHVMPRSVLVARQPQFGWFGNNIW